MDQESKSGRTVVVGSLLAILLCALFVTLCYFFVDRQVAFMRSESRRSANCCSAALYNTGHNYDPVTGLPDANDWNHKPPGPDNPRTGQVSFTASIRFTPIDTSKYNDGGLYQGAANVSSKFDGMLFFQRRRIFLVE